MTEQHWASALVNKSWAPGAEGPDTFDCWGLVRFVFRTRLGIEMPPLTIGIDQPSEENVTAIKEASTVSGWRKADGPEREKDIILMRNLEGNRHVGTVIRVLGSLYILHAHGSIKDGIVEGAVILSRPQDLYMMGYSRFEYWRLA